MIMIRGFWLLAFFMIMFFQAPSAQSATYYISPTGSDADPGTSAKPWLTFAYAINPARATCGDTLILDDGTYGDDTSTGKISIINLLCTHGNELTIRAKNQRKAKIVDNGSGDAVSIRKSAYIIIDGLYARSTDLSGSTLGTPFNTRYNHHITLKNLVCRNPNRYANTHCIAVEFAQDVLVEDSEGYIFHRHCVEAWQSERVVVRRQYCNPRGGKIPAGFGLNQGPVGSGAAVVSMYPCKDCILENSIADGTTHPMFLNEMNATFGSGILMSGSKVLGSICYKCNYGNGVYASPRLVADFNHTPHNITVQDVAFIEQASMGYAVRATNVVNGIYDHLTIIGTRSGGGGGILADLNTTFGSTPSQNSISVTNVLVTGMTGAGFVISSKAYNTWTINKTISNENGTAYSPSYSTNLTNISTSAHGMGSCKVWVPAGAAGKGAGVGKSDIGANILYRYYNGVLTSTPLWDPKTGEFPHGASDLDGTNRVAGQSLFDIHIRLNVNTGGCSFPKDYGSGNSDSTLPAAPNGLRAS